MRCSLSANRQYDRREAARVYLQTKTSEISSCLASAFSFEDVLKIHSLNHCYSLCIWLSATGPRIASVFLSLPLLGKQLDCRLSV
jgi:hypothetical protein